MALAVTVTKKAVTQNQEGMWHITLNMVCTDSAVEVINQDYTMRYKTGNDIEVVVKKSLEEMQRTINYYKSSQVVFNHTKLNNAVTYLNTNLVG